MTMRKLFLILAAGISLMTGYFLPAKAELKPADVIIGLGFGPAKNKKGEPRDELKRRVDKAVEVYKQGLAPYIIFTGTDTGAGVEAEVMKELAVMQGVPPDKIITETKATDTITNAKYSVTIMRSRNWTKCILVSNPYHLRRAKMLFEASPGISVQLAPTDSPPNPFYHLALILYEANVRFQYLFSDVRAKAAVPENPAKP